MALRIAGLAILYCLTVFAVGFALGALRTIYLVPALGELPAVALELPVMLAVSWLAAGWLVRGKAALGPGDALAVGLIALILLLLFEAGLFALMNGAAPWGITRHWMTAAGALGLLGQLAFGLLPWIRARRA